MSYELVFDVGGPIDPTDLARRLLQTDIGVSAVNYATGSTEVANRFKKLIELKADASALREADGALKTGGARSYLGWLIRHPAAAIRLVGRSLRRGTVERNGEDDTPLAQLLDETDDLIDESMATIGWIESLQHFVDSQLYQPRYLADVPFSRVSLQSFVASTGRHEIGGDVSLLLHRSGTAVIKFYVLIEDELSIPEVLDLQMPSLIELETIEAPKEIWAGRLKEAGLTWSDLAMESRFSSGIAWAKLAQLRGESLSDFFIAYAEAVLRIAVDDKPDPWSRTLGDGWHLYPVTFIRRLVPQCHTLGELRARPAVLGPLLLRKDDWERYRPDRLQALMDGDLGRSTDTFVHIGVGHALVVYMEDVSANLRTQFGDDVPGQEWLARHFNTVCIIELVLLQRWILRGIDDQLRYRKLGSRDLAELRVRALDALEEYHQVAPLAYGDAQEMVKSARVTLGLEDHYSAVKSKLLEVESMTLAQESRVRARRGRILQAATAVGTLVLGLASAWAVVNVLQEWDAGGTLTSEDGVFGWLRSVAESATQSPVLATLIVYMGIIGVLLPLIIWSLLPARGISRRSSTPDSRGNAPGFSWPGGTIQWVSAEDPTANDRTEDVETR